MIDKLNSFLEYLDIEKNYSINTINSYNKDISSFISFLKQNNIDNVDYNIIRKYLIYLYEKKYKNKTIARHISSLKSFYKFLYRNDFIKENPFILISTPKIEKLLPNYLNITDLEILINVSDNSSLGLRNRLIIEMLYSTGVRVSELVNIKMSDIDFSNKRITILGKGNKERNVLYGKTCENYLIEYIDKSRSKLIKKDCEYLFLNKNGTTLSDRGVRLIINDIVKKSSLRLNVSPHTFRHTFATHLLSNGADLKTVQELLGHENISTTGIYTHVSNEHLRNVYLNSHPRAKKKD